MRLAMLGWLLMIRLLCVTGCIVSLLAMTFIALVPQGFWAIVSLCARGAVKKTEKKSVWVAVHNDTIQYLLY